jgi:hypothetical protein
LSPIDSDIYALGNRLPAIKVSRTEQPWAPMRATFI